MFYKKLATLILFSTLFLSINGQDRHLQLGYRLLSSDFDETIRFSPFNGDIPVFSGVGLSVFSPYTDYFAVGGDIRVGLINNVTDEIDGPSQGNIFFSATALGKVQKFKRGSWFKPFFQAGLGIQNVRPETKWNPAIVVGGGIDLEVAKSISFGLSTNYTREFSRNRYFMEYAIGVSILLNDGYNMEEALLENMADNDSDGDGILNDQDDCPTLAGSLFTSGCPDSDGDGVSDLVDECPDEPGLSTYNGCPVVSAENDTERTFDNKGEIADVKDLKDSLGLGDQNMNKELELASDDADGDGIIDRLDECPDVYGSIDLNGCPEPDMDNDGVSDVEDKCPTIPGSIYLDGCPEEQVNEDKELSDFDEKDNESQQLDEEDLEENSEEVEVSEEPDILGEKADKRDAENLSDTSIVEEKVAETKGQVQRESLEEDKETIGATTGINSSTEVSEVEEKVNKALEGKPSEVGEEEVVQEEKEQLGIEQEQEVQQRDSSRIGSEEAKDQRSDSPPTGSEKVIEGKSDHVATAKTDTVVIVKTEQRIEKVVEEKIVRIDDRDQDGIADHIDPCPDLYGTLENKGCPTSSTNIPSTQKPYQPEISIQQPQAETQEILNDPEVSAKSRFAYTPMIHFQTGVAALQKQYVDELEEIAAFLRSNPEFDLKIYGHTDSKGSSGLNEVLSERRAKACYTFLKLASKIPESRMSYHGEGEYSPISDNFSSQGRFQNRRVVFDFIRR